MLFLLEFLTSIAIIFTFTYIVFVFFFIFFSDFRLREYNTWFIGGMIITIFLWATLLKIERDSRMTTVEFSEVIPKEKIMVDSGKNCFVYYDGKVFSDFSFWQEKMIREGNYGLYKQSMIKNSLSDGRETLVEDKWIEYNFFDREGNLIKSFSEK